MMKRALSRIFQGNGLSPFSVLKPKYAFGLFDFSKVKTGAKENMEKMKILQQQLKDYKEEKRFMIRRPFSNDFFMSKADRDK